MRRTSSALLVIVIAGWLHVAPAAAQAVDPGAPPVKDDSQPAGEGPKRGFFPTLGHNLVDDVKHIPRLNSLYWLAGGTAVALAIHPEDGKINRRLLGSSTADTLFKPGKFIGNGAIVAVGSIGTYVVGRTMNMPRVEHVGMDEIEAMILSESIAQLVKMAVQRDRPVDPTGHQAAGYSFPSGHATLTFAAATVLQQHLGYKAGVPTYLLASYVAMSRLHDNRHFASDVVMGATTGIIIGRSVTWHGRNFWGRPSVVPVPRGAALMFTAQPQF